MIRPTNRKKRKKLAKQGKLIGEGAFILRMNKNSPSYRRMLTKQKAWRKSLGPEKYAVTQQEILDYINKAQYRLGELLGHKVF